ncbi:AraC family transcriptional regulator [Phyllobacterium sp. P30BS-XVII]|uniref:helix-turn-helix domain-containing protein n=1 Tax=Phyllobacterium sp. P30BS-XVII TaxID=2587046 RepID=UPI00182E07BC|nr:AraC family transcriptional regulator [Phyllobacterium sp. P30BS-XVII]MBA8901153.1 AraC-like DNA-binding protein [Phyllobacterium sp. P30BS-XVII]
MPDIFMLFVPLPFVVAVLLVVLLIQMIRRNDGSVTNPFFLALISVYALQSVVIGVRWGYNMLEILPLQAVLAVIIATLAWLSFEGLRTERPPTKRPLLLLHVLPTLLIIGLIAFWPAPISLTIIVIFAGYGIALCRLAWRGPDALGSSRLDGVISAYRALQITAFAIASSAIIDVVISWDFAESGGTHSGRIVAIGNVLAMLVLGAAATVAGTSRPEERIDTSAEEGALPVAPSGEDTDIATALDSLMQSRELYRDVDLNLNRLARKMGLSARQVSTAVNRVKAMSVSQYVNDFRVKEACRLLADTELSVTNVMFDAGFQTKSNFNREFLRVTGLSPKAWRANALARDNSGGTVIRLAG